MFTLGRLLDATAGRVVRGAADPSLTFRGGAFDSAQDSGRQGGRQG